jgi:hypothetical protein
MLKFRTDHLLSSLVGSSEQSADRLDGFQSPLCGEVAALLLELLDLLDERRSANRCVDSRCCWKSRTSSWCGAYDLLLEVVYDGWLHRLTSFASKCAVSFWAGTSAGTSQERMAQGVEKVESLTF